MRPPVNPNRDVRGRRTTRALDVTKRRGPGSWVYIGTYPTDPYTTFDSPPWQNGWTHALGVYDRVAFRWGAHYELEFKGVPTLAAATGALAFTLPVEYRPAKTVTVIRDVWTGSALSAARWTIATDGTVSIAQLATGGANLPWAVASAAQLSVTASGGKFQPSLTRGRASDSTNFSLSSGYLQVNTPGYYLMMAYIVKSGVLDNTRDNFLQPLFLSSGTPSDIQDNQGLTDYFGDWRSPNDYLYTGDQAGTTLATQLTFKWDPGSPISNLDFENPLKVAVHLATFPNQSGSITIGSGVFLMRIASASFVTL